MVEKSILYDLRGLRCPLVLLKARKKRAVLALATKLVILSDDPMSPLDIANYCQKNNYTFEKRYENGIHYLSIISKKLL